MISTNPFQVMMRLILLTTLHFQLWINANRLFLNVEKTSFRTLSNITNKNCEHTTKVLLMHLELLAFKFLGFMIDETRKLDVHIYKVCTKILQSIGIFRRLSSMVPDNVLHGLYYAFTYSRITFAVCASESAFSTALKRLKCLVNNLYQFKVYLRTDLKALFFNMTRFKNTSFYANCSKFYAMVNIYVLFLKWTST